MAAGYAIRSRDGVRSRSSVLERRTRPHRRCPGRARSAEPASRRGGSATPDVLVCRCFGRAAIGVFSACGGPRSEPFTDKQIELVTTFADQAVIAIENVRLFRSSRPGTATSPRPSSSRPPTSEVLKVISRSTFDLQPVLDTLIENATKLCDAPWSPLSTRRRDVARGCPLSRLAGANRGVAARAPYAPDVTRCAGRVALTHRAVQILDVLDDPEYQPFRAQRVGALGPSSGCPCSGRARSLGSS